MFALLLLLASPFDACEQEFRAAAHPSDAYMCFYFTAQEHRLWKEGEDRVAALLTSSPDKRAWLRLVLGHFRVRNSSALGEESYREAASELARQNEAKGEILARNNLTRLLERAGRIDEAREQIELVRDVAERSGDAELIVRARVSEADYLASSGLELSRAYRSLKRAESFAFPNSSRGLQRRCLGALGEITYRMGRLDESIATFERLLTMLEEDGDVSAASMITFNIANARLNQVEHLPDPRAREETLALAMRSLKLANESENLRTEAFVRRLVAALLPRHNDNARESRDHLDRCDALASELDNAERKIDCLWTRAEVVVDADPAGAERAIDEAADIAVKLDLKRFIPYTARTRAKISWKTKPFEDAVSDGFAAIDAVESLRDLQAEEGGRAELFSDWTQDYYTLSGKLLEAGDLERGFDVIERMRARVLLDSIEASLSLADLPENPARTKLLETIASVQRQLLDPGLETTYRERALAELEQLELDEAELRAAEPTGRVGKPNFASLQEIRRTLSDDEAMLSFQVALTKDAYEDFGGGAWLLLVTRHSARVFPIPDRVALTPKTPVFLGLIARGDGTEKGAAARLYDELLGDALATLPPDVDKLIVVPDGPLHRLPIDVLRNGDIPLASQFEITMVPSATLWRRWRTKKVASTYQSPALAFADPALGGGAARSETRTVVLREGLTLGALPYARKEGRAIARHLGGTTELLLGDKASERAVKNAELTHFGVLHFAAHAIADTDNPERSAVVLSPGADSEDGLLQIREIAELELNGQVVVLSACQTASGRMLSGEGVLSLARAFLRAGAQTVVASRWPLRDDDAARLFDRFYRTLATGASVAASLRAAKVEAIGAGVPASSWSSLTLYGNGAVMPVEPHEPSRRWMLLASLAIVTSLALLLYGLKSRRRSTAAAL